MSKKTNYILKLTSQQEAVVEKGNKIKIGDTIAKSQTVEIIEFNLAKTLGVKPENVSQYVKIKDKTQVKTGAALAVKKKLLKKQIVKAPTDGEFIILDLKQGLYGIKKINQENSIPFLSWFEGEVVDVNKDQISLTVFGQMIQSKQGKGKPVSGKLKVIGEIKDIFLLPTDLEQTILVINNITSEIAAKADALGALALIAETLDEPSFSLPYLIFEKTNDLKEYHNKNVIVYGDEKHIIISETTVKVNTKK